MTNDKVTTIIGMAIGIVFIVGVVLFRENPENSTEILSFCGVVIGGLITMFGYFTNKPDSKD